MLFKVYCKIYICIYLRFVLLLKDFIINITPDYNTLRLYCIFTRQVVIRYISSDLDYVLELHAVLFYMSYKYLCSLYLSRFYWLRYWSRFIAVFWVSLLIIVMPFIGRISIPFWRAHNMSLIVRADYDYQRTYVIRLLANLRIPNVFFILNL